jgi:hypothetical protein
MRTGPFAAVALIVAVSSAYGTSAYGQYYAYPSFQPPRVSQREYNFAAADGDDAGTSLVFQWREGIAQKTHLQLDAGFADPNAPRADARLILGLGLGHQVARASADMPLDLVATVGFGGSFVDGRSILRLPVGLSVGHRFEFDVPLSVTPYAHPRLSLDICSECGGNGRRDSNLGVDVDIGVGVEISRSLELRASALFAGSDFFARDNSLGISLAWIPRGLN